MNGFIPKGKLTAYQRWELASFDEEDEGGGGIPDEPRPGPAASAGAEPAISRESMIPLPTAEDIERIHEEAHAQGHAEGHAEGYAAGYAEGKEQGIAEGLAEARAVARKIGSVLDQLSQATGELDQHIADQLLATAIEIANQVMRQSLKLKPELLLPVVREAVSALHPGAGHPALLAHPDDAALIRTHMGESLAHNNWRIIDDPSITRGGCRVELGSSDVDATIQTRWRRVIEAIGVSQDWLADLTPGARPDA